MATYVIGDVQGCFYSLQNLLEKIDFQPDDDEIWFLGDLINRGAHSLKVLKWVYAHRKSVHTVLGNHDLHAIAVYEGYAKLKRGDTIAELLASPNAAKWFNWLRQQPLLTCTQGSWLVHAGLLPQWTTAQAHALAGEVESVLRSDDYLDFFKHMYGNQPTLWHGDLTGIERYRLITNAMTRLRFCEHDGAMDFAFKGEREQAPAHLQPWFDFANCAWQPNRIIFGHWSALGLMLRDDAVCLDTGCVWGDKLTAMRLQDDAIFQVNCDGRDQPQSISLL